MWPRRRPNGPTSAWMAGPRPGRMRPDGRLTGIYPSNITSSRSMIVTTTENIPGTRVVKTIGQVFGLTVRSRSLGGNIAAGLKSLVGGAIRSYVKLNEDSRRQALDRMVQNAAA